MFRKVVWQVALIVVFAAAPAFAQPRVEISGIIGWTFSDGVEGQPRLAQDGNIYDAVDVVDSFNWGFGIGVLATENAEVGFMYGRQESRLDVVGTNTFEVGDMTVSTYHGYFAYNFGPADSPVRPVRARRPGRDELWQRPLHDSRSVGGDGRRDAVLDDLGRGREIRPSRGIGVRAGLQWTPTYIKSDAVGCVVRPVLGVMSRRRRPISNQFSFNGGVIFRFSVFPATCRARESSRRSESDVFAISRSSRACRVAASLSPAASAARIAPATARNRFGSFFIVLSNAASASFGRSPRAAFCRHLRAGASGPGETAHLSIASSASAAARIVAIPSSRRPSATLPMLRRYVAGRPPGGPVGIGPGGQLLVAVPSSR